MWSEMRGTYRNAPKRNPWWWKWTGLSTELMRDPRQSEHVTKSCTCCAVVWRRRRSFVTLYFYAYVHTTLDRNNKFRSLWVQFLPSQFPGWNLAGHQCSGLNRASWAHCQLYNSKQLFQSERGPSTACAHGLRDVHMYSCMYVYHVAYWANSQNSSTTPRYKLWQSCGTSWKVSNIGKLTCNLTLRWKIH